MLLWLCLRQSVPVCPGATGLRRRPAVPPGCRCSLRADTGRWFGAGRGCSSGSTRSCSGYDPGSGWRGNADPHLSPWWRRGPWRKRANRRRWAITVSVRTGKSTDADRINADRLPVMLIRVQRLVAGFVAFNSPLEVQHGVSLVAVPVVWTWHLHFLCREGRLSDGI